MGSVRKVTTVLGKIPVAPKPINLPSQKLERWGVDSDIEIVPRGTSCWGSCRNAVVESNQSINEDEELPPLTQSCTINETVNLEISCLPLHAELQQMHELEPGDVQSSPKSELPREAVGSHVEVVTTNCILDPVESFVLESDNSLDPQPQYGEGPTVDCSPAAADEVVTESSMSQMPDYIEFSGLTRAPETANEAVEDRFVPPMPGVDEQCYGPEQGCYNCSEGFYYNYSPYEKEEATHGFYPFTPQYNGLYCPPIYDNVKDRETLIVAMVGSPGFIGGYFHPPHAEQLGAPEFYGNYPVSVDQFGMPAYYCTSREGHLPLTNNGYYPGRADFFCYDGDAYREGTHELKGEQNAWMNGTSVGEIQFGTWMNVPCVEELQFGTWRGLTEPGVSDSACVIAADLQKNRLPKASRKNHEWSCAPRKDFSRHPPKVESSSRIFAPEKPFILLKKASRSGVQSSPAMDTALKDSQGSMKKDITSLQNLEVGKNGECLKWIERKKKFKDALVRGFKDVSTSDAKVLNVDDGLLLNETRVEDTRTDNAEQIREKDLKISKAGVILGTDFVSANNEEVDNKNASGSVLSIIPEHEMIDTGLVSITSCDATVLPCISAEQGIVTNDELKWKTHIPLANCCSSKGRKSKKRAFQSNCMDSVLANQHAPCPFQRDEESFNEAISFGNSFPSGISDKRSKTEKQWRPKVADVKFKLDRPLHSGSTESVSANDQALDCTQRVEDDRTETSHSKNSPDLKFNCNGYKWEGVWRPKPVNIKLKPDISASEIQLLEGKPECSLSKEGNTSLSKMTNLQKITPVLASEIIPCCNVKPTGCAESEVELNGSSYQAELYIKAHKCISLVNSCAESIVTHEHPAHLSHELGDVIMMDNTPSRNNYVLKVWHASPKMEKAWRPKLSGLKCEVDAEKKEKASYPVKVDSMNIMLSSTREGESLHKLIPCIGLEPSTALNCKGQEGDLEVSPSIIECASAYTQVLHQSQIAPTADVTARDDIISKLGYNRFKRAKEWRPKSQCCGSVSVHTQCPHDSGEVMNGLTEDIRSKDVSATKIHYNRGLKIWRPKQCGKCIPVVETSNDSSLKIAGATAEVKAFFPSDNQKVDDFQGRRILEATAGKACFQAPKIDSSMDEGHLHCVPFEKHSVDMYTKEQSTALSLGQDVKFDIQQKILESSRTDEHHLVEVSSPEHCGENTTETIYVHCDPQSHRDIDGFNSYPLISNEIQPLRRLLPLPKVSGYIHREGFLAFSQSSSLRFRFEAKVSVKLHAHSLLWRPKCTAAIKAPSTDKVEETTGRCHSSELQSKSRGSCQDPPFDKSKSIQSNAELSETVKAFGPPHQEESFKVGFCAMQALHQGCHWLNETPAKGNLMPQWKQGFRHNVGFTAKVLEYNNRKPSMDRLNHSFGDKHGPHGFRYVSYPSQGFKQWVKVVRPMDKR